MSRKDLDIKDPSTWPDKPGCVICGKQFGYHEGWMVNLKTFDMYHKACKEPASTKEKT